MKQVKVFGHRGASCRAPENTLPAFAQAMQEGADGIELDVHLSRDGELVVIHDEKLDRTTHAKGLVCEHTLAELREICADNGMPGFPEARIPTLREVLELVRPSQMQVNIEIKTGILWYKGIEQKTLELVREMGMQDRVVYSSFNHYSIGLIRSLDPAARTAYLFGDVLCEAENYAAAHGVNGLHPSLWTVKMDGLLRRYLDSGLDLRVWTVNEEADLRWLIEQQVDAVITNDPALACRVRGEILDAGTEKAQ